MPVLVVDDNKGLQELMELVLREGGYSCLAAGNGVDALRLLDEVRPSVILLNLNMPGMDGAEFLRQYRARPDGSTPVVLVTGAPVTPEAAAQLGADDLLTKPFDVDSLLTMVAWHRRLSAGGASTAAN